MVAGAGMDRRRLSLPATLDAALAAMRKPASWLARRAGLSGANRERTIAGATAIPGKRHRAAARGSRPDGG